MNAAILVTFVAAPALAQFCPSYTLSSPNNTGSCATEAVRGTNPTVAQWQTIFDTVSRGQAAWGSNGPPIGMLGVGCNRPTPPSNEPARFPCELIKAITMQESGWRQFCPPTTPSDQVGRPSQTIIAFDCGYGVGQVTSGMRSFDPTPSYDRSRVASDALYNLATGMQILTEKWRATNCVGDNQPRIVEHWYTATWAYNGLSTGNNPNNPNFSTTRGICRPGSCPSGSAPYQERVWGWMEFPPTPQHWPVIRPAYPRLSDLGTGSRPPALPDPTCASPTSCTQTRSLNVSACLAGDGGVPDGGVPDGGSTGGGAAGGGSAGGSTAGGSAGGNTAGGSAGGSTAGGSTAGGAAGGDAGGTADGGSSGGAAGGEPNFAVLRATPIEYPVPKGCGCTSGGSFGLGLIVLLGLRRSKNSRHAPGKP
jgi:hypothetical protein